MVCILNVATYQNCLPAGLFNPIFCLSCIFVFAEIGDEYVRSFSGIGDGNRPAYPTICSGDHGFLAGEAPRSPVGMFAMVGDRLHLGREARHGLLLLGEGRFGFVHHGLTFGFVCRGTTGLASLFRTEARRLNSSCIKSAR